MPDMPTDATLEAALNYQDGWGREATAAHPDCLCGKPTGKTDWRWVDGEGNPAQVRYSRSDCPMHRGDRR